MREEKRPNKDSAIRKLDVYKRQHLSRAKANSFFKWAQIISGAGVAVLHGAQDGQKFLSLCMLGIMIGMSGAVDSNVEFPFWLIILVSATMALGTACLLYTSLGLPDTL